MAKKEKKETKYKKEEPQQEGPETKLPEEVQEKLKAAKSKLEKFQKSVVEKFDKYISGIALLPPQKGPAHEEKKEEQFNILVLVDDTEPTKMTKQELKEKLVAIMESTAKEIDERIKPQTLLLTELWQNCYDGKYELLQLIALAAPIYDTGMLSAIKIAEVHKTMVLKKFEKYIVAYVLAGSLVQGKATKQSDIDVFIVVDDTDVKKMTRFELKDKLRAIIIGMGIEAGAMTGVQNKLNVQVYILTDFWESIREANPVIFTFLRDGVPFFDRGIFMPWKQLLKMGKIKPSTEAIDMYMSSGEQMLERVRFKLKDIGTEDFFWAILTPSQAALMLYGIPPPTPRETPELMREIFVIKEKLLEENDIKILEKVLKIRKEIEHGNKKEISGKEIDEMLGDCEKYLARLKRLFTQIEKIKDEESMTHIYETIVTVIRDCLTLEGVEKAEEAELIEKFEEELVAKGKVPARFVRLLHEIMKAKKAYEAGKLSKTELEQARKNAAELIKFLVEYMQRKRAQELERTKFRARWGEKTAEITLLGNTAYIVKDISAEEKEILCAKIESDGGLESPEKCSIEDFEKALAKISIPPQVFIREKTFEGLKKILGRDIEILLV